MKYMKKLVAVLLAAVMAMSLLTACGGGGGGGGSASGGNSMNKVFDFTGEELTQAINKEMNSNAVYDEYLGPRFADAINAAILVGGQIDDQDQANEIVESIMKSSGFENCEGATAFVPRNATATYVAKSLAASFNANGYTVTNQKIGYAGAKVNGNNDYYMVFAILQ